MCRATDNQIFQITRSLRRLSEMLKNVELGYDDAIPEALAEIAAEIYKVENMVYEGVV